METINIEGLPTTKTPDNTKPIKEETDERVITDLFKLLAMAEITDNRLGESGPYKPWEEKF